MEKIKIHKITAKEKKKLHIWIRAMIQLGFFVFLPSAYTAAFSGAKYIFTRLGNSELIGMSSFVLVLITLCVYTVIFGRFFCGFACAFGSLGDAVHALYIMICKKIKKKPIQLSEKTAKRMGYVKYLILLGIVLSCFFGVYGKLQGTSPWDVFSMIHAGNFQLQKYIPGVVILVLILVGMCVQERFFCRFLCPMGAIFSLLPVLPLFSLQRDRESCLKGCRACTRKCPSDIELPDHGKVEVQGDCFQCQKCIDTCPKSNIHCHVSVLKGNEVWLTILRALVLLALMMRLGI